MAFGPHSLTRRTGVGRVADGVGHTGGADVAGAATVLIATSDGCKEERVLERGIPIVG